MLSYRAVAIFSNFAFIGYGFLEGLLPVMALHAILLPLNIYALTQLGFDGLPRRFGRRHTQAPVALKTE